MNMKSLSQFIKEAQSKSQAVIKATRLGLTSDGHGGLYDKNGEYVAKTDHGDLKFFNQNQRPGQDPKQDRTAANQQAVGTQTRPQAEPQSARAQAQQEPSKVKGSRREGPLTLAFGRFNPPTTGHKKLFDKVSSVAKKGEYKIYPSRSYDPKKNPLDPDTKIATMRRMFPDYGEKIVNDEDSKTIFDVLKKAYADGYKSVNIVVGSDRQAEFKKLANLYNGCDLYNFDEIEVVSAGDRDPDAEGIEGMSASKMRKAAADDDYDTFRQGVPDSFDDGAAKQFFNTVKKSMKVKKEEWSLWEIAPKLDFRNLRENYVNHKIFRVGQWVENLNTGLIGEIIRRGTNYVICLTEDKMVFKPWIKDIVEYTETKMDSMYRAPGKPNTLVGTTGYRKYVEKMPPGSEWGKQFINKYKAKKR